MPLLLLFPPIASTIAGGLFAIHFRRYLTLLTAVGAGLLLGAAFLDLLPEAVWLGAHSGLSTSYVLGWALLSFILFYAVEGGLRVLAIRWESQQVHHRLFRKAGAVMLILHSFRDGMAIGAAFSASHAAGYAVACGIAAHDLGDGMNTIILTTRGQKPTWRAYVFLLADALAPLTGGLATMWWTLSERSSVVVLVLAAGFFLAMATADFLPELWRGNSSGRHLVPAVLAGVAIIYLANLTLARFHF